MKTVAIEIPATVRTGLIGRREAGESDAVRKIDQSINYMLRHLDEPLQVATLAAQANEDAVKVQQVDGVVDIQEGLKLKITQDQIVAARRRRTAQAW